MENEIQEKLEEIYNKNKILIIVTYKDIRQYQIELQIENFKQKFEIIYDCKLTFDTNISIITHIIDKFIISNYLKI